MECGSLLLLEHDEMHMKSAGMQDHLMRAVRRRGRHGLTLVEIVVGLMLTVVILFALAPALAQNLVMKGVFWEIRVATRVVDAQLEQTCYDVGKPGATQFTALPGVLGVVPIPSADLPPELKILNPATDATVTWVYVDPITLLSVGAAPSGLLRVTATVNWVSRGHPMTKTGEYLISQLGICKPV